MPTDDPEVPPSPISRRTLLLGLGFGAANVAIIGKLVTEPHGSTSEAEAGSSVQVKRSTAPTDPPVLAGTDPALPAEHVFDRVISGGRVVDPETGYDSVANVGIDGERITAISTGPLTGRATIDAANLVVSPGFIDLLSYAPNDHGNWFKIGDGVTTNLCMHGINQTAKDFFATHGGEAQRPPLNYGGAFDDAFMRSQLKIKGSASAQQIDGLVAAVEQSFIDGYIGLSFEPEYTPEVQDDEIRAMVAMAKLHNRPSMFHVRYSSPDEPGKDNATAIAEVLNLARSTGGAVHIDHITSTGGTHTMPQTLASIEQARSEGVDVTACMYPYDFWATTAASARFYGDWQKRFRITYSDLAIPGSGGERLTESTFNKAVRANKLVAAYAIPEQDVIAGLQTDWIMIGSDAILQPSNNNHPRAAGCFTRVLGHYVRDQGVLTLMQALSKMTILPAQRLQSQVPALQRKGRLQIGADADITIFDPTTVADTATIDDPAQMAKGVSYVMVMGQVVKEGDTVHRDVRPGQPIKGVV